MPVADWLYDTLENATIMLEEMKGDSGLFYEHMVITKIVCSDSLYVQRGEE